jgi:hypothetical protein
LRGAGSYRRTGKRDRSRRFQLGRVKERQQISAKLQQRDFRFSCLEHLSHAGADRLRGALRRLQARKLFDFPHLSEHDGGQGERQSNQRARTNKKPAIAIRMT